MSRDADPYGFEQSTNDGSDTAEAWGEVCYGHEWHAEEVAAPVDDPAVVRARQVAALPRPSEKLAAVAPPPPPPPPPPRRLRIRRRNSVSGLLIAGSVVVIGVGLGIYLWRSLGSTPLGVLFAGIGIAGGVFLLVFLRATEVVHD